MVRDRICRQVRGRHQGARALRRAALAAGALQGPPKGRSGHEQKVMRALND